MRELENFIDPLNMTSEMAIIDNIAHELKRLNTTMSFISETLLFMGKYFQEQK